MRILRFIPLVSTGISVLLTPWTHAVAGDAVQQRVHVHGVAELALALEGSELEILFTSPAISVLGFEHRAVTDAQAQAVAEAEIALRDTTGLFAFTGTRCELRETTLDFTAVLDAAPEPHHGHGEQGHGEDGDGEHEDGEHEDGEHHHAGEESHGHEAEESHSDIGAQYKYRCADSADLKALRVGSDGLPFGLETINVMWVSDKAQGATRLTADRQVIEFE